MARLSRLGWVGLGWLGLAWVAAPIGRPYFRSEFTRGHSSWWHDEVANVLAVYIGTSYKCPFAGQDSQLSHICNVLVWGVSDKCTGACTMENILATSLINGIA